MTEKWFWASLLLISILFLSGCASGQVDVTPIVKTLPEVKEFLRQNPDAEVKAVLMTEGAVSANIDVIRQDCEYLPVKSYWKVTLRESEINMTVWLDADTKQPVCVFQKGQDAKQLPKRPEGLKEVETPSNEDLKEVETPSNNGDNPPPPIVDSGGGGAGGGQGGGCYDTDGGKDIFVKGTAAGYTDYCPSEITVFEYTCENNGGLVIVNGHRYYCPSGFVCQYGACRTKPSTEENNRQEEDFSCFDSDGGGNSEVYRNGTVTFCSTITFSGSDGGGGGRGCGNSEDYCTGNVVTEYACTDSKITSYKYTCLYSCSDGACQGQSHAQLCSDSDGGINYSKKGTVSLCSVETDGKYKYEGKNCANLSSIFEYCSGNILTENYCDDNNNSASQEYICPFACSNGECINPQTTTKTCTDSDGGGNSEITRNGTVTVCTNEVVASSSSSSEGGGGGSGGGAGGSCVSYSDYCIGNLTGGSTVIYEYHCIDQKSASAVYTCDYGCSNGKCISQVEANSSTGSGTGGAGGGGGGG